MSEQYLVLGRCYMEDIPLAIYDNYIEAERYCSIAKQNPDGVLSDIRARGEDLGLDPPDLICLDVFRMHGHLSIEQVHHVSEEELWHDEAEGRG